MSISQIVFDMHVDRQPAVYVVANRYRGTIYVGVTSDLWNRINDHKNGTTPGFTSQYVCKILVWYEHHHMMEDAIKREKQIKAWKRDWKIRMIEAMNPEWKDLQDSIDNLSTLVEMKLDPSLRWGDGT